MNYLNGKDNDEFKIQRCKEVLEQTRNPYEKLAIIKNVLNGEWHLIAQWWITDEDEK